MRQRIYLKKLYLKIKLDSSTKFKKGNVIVQTSNLIFRINIDVSDFYGFLNKMKMF